MTGGEAAAKVLLRREMKRRLAETPDEDLAAAARRIRERVAALPEVAGAGGVFTCLSFGREVDTWELARLLHDPPARRLFVPRSTKGDSALHLHPWPCPMERLSFGLRQPVRAAPELPPEEIDAAVDVALVLGLGFDLAGYRLGYGAGYFDRFLAGRRFATIGVALERQVVEELPREPHDVPLGLLVTEEGVRRFPERGIAARPPRL